ncbi:MAG: hypothetical protein F6K22_25705 [Okeania sp. SIO2F4]|uniref:hypothetical protein n=1 Tax=Okeania sp. SIO2F4 TaxID=2607790 RepID=UPI001428D8AA|nr:hypothetical protein [Okeania sp. SIO2F4]NES05901.1 hypothetical protein [Okeania sp. SIO2F4]
MPGRYKNGQLVRIYGSSKIVQIDDIQLRGDKYYYSFVDPNTKIPLEVHFSNGGYKRDWQEERWLSSVK